MDLDHSLVASDLIWECVAALLKSNPLLLLMVPVWFVSGIAYGKRKLANAAGLDPTSLPYREEVLDYLREQRILGRRIVLATAADETLANGIADHLLLFDAVYASDGKTNLKGSAKAQFLEQKFGERGYAYLGDSTSDFKVWRSAAASLVVSSSDALSRRAALLAPLEKQFRIPHRTWQTLFRSIRLHHWTKNLLIFLPMMLGHQFSLRQITKGFAAFVLFGLAASSMYLLNDVLDLKSDRQHPWKRRRPLASGELPIASGLGLFAALFSAALALGGTLLGPGFATVTAGYCLVVLLYTLRFKKEPLLDVFVLSSFYVFRILLGGVVTSVPLSKWFIVFSSFFFLSMAFAKRYSELVDVHDLADSSHYGRGYRQGDREVIAITGIGAALCSIVIFCLFAESQDVLAMYAHPVPLLLVGPVVLYWITRVWLRAHRGELREDPLTLALTDPNSYWMAAIVLLLVVLSMFPK